MVRSGKLLGDRLHKAFVMICMGTTVIGTGVLAIRAAKHLIYVYPEVRAKKAKAEENLLLEGKPRDTLSDTAPTLTP